MYLFYNIQDAEAAMLLHPPPPPPPPGSMSVNGESKISFLPVVRRALCNVMVERSSILRKER
jgi:hypothetical protein